MSERTRLFWEGTLFARHSLAHVNREIGLGLLAEPSVDLSLVPFEPDEDDFGPRYQALRERDIRVRGLSLRGTGGGAARAPVWVRHLWPPRPRPPGRLRWISMQPWEYSVMPEALVRGIEGASQIWAPSRFSRAALCRSGLAEERVHVVPYGVDPEVFSPEGPSLELPTGKGFRFLFVGGTIHRKGIDVLLDAYRRAFRASEDVCLVIQDLADAAVYRGQTAGREIAAFQGIPENPEVLHLAAFRQHPQLAALYRSCHAFVSPYRGEGFSLPTLEAMASGLPVLVTGGGATDDFVDESVGWRIPSTPASVGSAVYGLPAREEAFLLEPDRDALAALLRTAYESPRARKERGAAGRSRAATRFSWRHTVAGILARIAASGLDEPR